MRGLGAERSKWAVIRSACTPLSVLPAPTTSSPSSCSTCLRRQQGQCVEGPARSGYPLQVFVRRRSERGVMEWRWARAEEACLRTFCRVSCTVFGFAASFLPSETTEVSRAQLVHRAAAHALQRTISRRYPSTPPLPCPQFPLGLPGVPASKC